MSELENTVASLEAGLTPAAPKGPNTNSQHNPHTILPPETVLRWFTELEPEGYTLTSIRRCTRTPSGENSATEG